MSGLSKGAALLSDRSSRTVLRGHSGAGHLAFAVAATLAVLAGPAIRSQDSHVSLAKADAVAASLAAADRELGALVVKLGEAADCFGELRRWGESDPGGEVNVRLALFPHRFGVRPEDRPAFELLRARARELLTRLDDPATRPPRDPADEPRVADRCSLLVVAGREEEALEALDFVQPDPHDGCGFCQAAVMAPLLERRSERAEQAGDLDLALRLLHGAVSDRIALIPWWDADPPTLVLARYGWLLRQAGEDRAARVVLSWVIGSWPESAGAQVAREFLHEPPCCAELVPGVAVASGSRYRVAAVGACVFGEAATRGGPGDPRPLDPAWVIVSRGDWPVRRSLDDGFAPPAVTGVPGPIAWGPNVIDGSGARDLLLSLDLDEEFRPQPVALWLASSPQALAGVDADGSLRLFGYLDGGDLPDEELPLRGAECRFVRDRPVPASVRVAWSRQLATAPGDDAIAAGLALLAAGVRPEAVVPGLGEALAREPVHDPRVVVVLGRVLRKLAERP